MPAFNLGLLSRIRLVSGAALFSTAALASAACAAPNAVTMKFAVTRDGADIGTHTINVARTGPDTDVQIVTHVCVGLAFLTLYKFDQTENEQWAGGHLLAMNSVTDDNGAIHRANASNRGGTLIVEGDAGMKKAPPTLLPISLWNPNFLTQNTALNPRDGSIVPVSVMDRGEDSLVVEGRAERVHHYKINAPFSEDVWYDDARRLVKVELTGSDGSTIRYQLI